MENMKKITVAPGSSVRDPSGKLLGGPGDRIEVDRKLADQLIAGHSAIEGWDELKPEDAPAVGKRRK